ncbi:MAG: flagellar basal body rod protein FlgB [Ignavibacteriaceae bacterium]|nr:flagellar basal body rod protein FlgB [Ignavibacteriaceae bacterium]
MQTPYIKSLERFIDYCSVKNKTLSKNIANVGTENYNREDVEFKDLMNSNLASILKTTSSKHIHSEQSANKDFEIIRDNSLENVSGVNNVDIDKEMADLAANTIHFRFASRKIGDYYRTLQNVIKGGGKL